MSENHSSKNKSKLSSTHGEVQSEADKLVTDVFKEALGAVIPEVVKGHDFKPRSKFFKDKNSSRQSIKNPEGNLKPRLRAESSSVFKTPPQEETFYTPPISPPKSVKVLFQQQQQPYDNKKNKARKKWHISEVMKTIRDSRWKTEKKPISKIDVESREKRNEEGNDTDTENAPLLNNQTDLPIKLTENKSRLKSLKSFVFKSSSANLYMSSRFSNIDYRQHFASKMLMYKAIHMLFGYLCAILFQMTWTWEREIQNLGPPDLVRLVSENFWIAYILLGCYISLAITVRVFYIGRKKPFNIILFVIFTTMFGCKCYAACVGLGQLGTAIITTVTYTLCLSYCAFSILLTLNKFPEKMDLTKMYVYNFVLWIILITSPLSWILNFIELKITDSVFQKQIGLKGSLIEDYLPSAIIAYLIFLWEMFRIKGIVEGKVVSLPGDDEFLFGAFFI